MENVQVNLDVGLGLRDFLRMDMGGLGGWVRWNPRGGGRAE